MASTGTALQIRRQMETVATKLDSPKLTSEQRMALLRRQAELGTCATPWPIAPAASSRSGGSAD